MTGEPCGTVIPSFGACLLMEESDEKESGSELRYGRRLWDL